MTIHKAAATTAASADTESSTMNDSCDVRQPQHMRLQQPAHHHHRSGRLAALTIFGLCISLVAGVSATDSKDVVASRYQRVSRVRGQMGKETILAPETFLLPEVSDEFFDGTSLTLRRRTGSKSSKSTSNAKKSKTPETSKLDRASLSSRQSDSTLDRYVLHCPDTLALDDCWEVAQEMGTIAPLYKVHNLSASHSLAIETNFDNIQLLESAGFWISKDTERETLELSGSLKFHHHGRRTLEENEQELGYHMDMIRAKEAWERFNVTGKGIKVCVMDTGIYGSHPDFNSGNLDGWNSTENFVVPWYEDVGGHGTHVSGIIAAANNTQGYVGVAPGVDLYVVRVFTDQGKFYGSDVVAAAQACRAAGSDIISMSLGGEGYDDGEDMIFQELYQQNGIIAVASAGNTGGAERIFPAAYSEVISVGACNADRKIAGFSTFNSHIDIIAPGTDIPSTYLPEKVDDPEYPYASLSGTSMAAPQIVSVLALLKSFDPTASAEELMYALKTGTQGLASKVVLGLVDAVAALETLDADIDLSSLPPPTCKIAELSLLTDQYGGETGFRLRRRSDRAIVWRAVGLKSNTEYLESTCLDTNDCYDIVLGDSYGDGILSPGWAVITYDGETIVNATNFGDRIAESFGDTC